MGLFDMAGSIINTGVQAGQNKKQRRWATAEAEKEWQRSLMMYNMQNEYNTPKNQMSRYQEAGLNPHLIYGQGTPGNTSTSTPQYHAAKGEFGLPQLNLSQPLSELQAYQDYRVQKANEKNIVANTAGTLTKNSWLNQKFSTELKKLAEETKNIAARTSNEALRAGLLKESTNYRNLSSQILTQDLELRRYGLSYQDPWWLRGLVKGIQNPTVSEFFQNSWSKWEPGKDVSTDINIQNHTNQKNMFD